MAPSLGADETSARFGPYHETLNARYPDNYLHQTSCGIPACHSIHIQQALSNSTNDMKDAPRVWGLTLNNGRGFRS